jgi:hypothetical protein
LVGIDGDGNVMGTFASRRDTFANIAAITLEAGELAFTTDTKDVFLGDGVTVGGIWLYGQPRAFAFNQTGLTVSSAVSAIVVEGLSHGSYTFEYTARFNHSGAGTSNFAVQHTPSDWLLNPDPVPLGYMGGTSTVFCRATWSDGTIQLANSTFFIPGSGQSAPGRVTAPITNLELNDAAVQIHGGFRLNSSAANVAGVPANSFAIQYFKRLIFGSDQTGVALTIMGSLRRVG